MWILVGNASGIRIVCMVAYCLIWWCFANVCVRFYPQLPLILGGVGLLGGLYYAKENGYLDTMVGVPSVTV